MEPFEVLRYGDAAGEAMLGLATEHGAHRRMVRQALASAICPSTRSSAH
jgi:hypothetical protein